MVNRQLNTVISPLHTVTKVTVVDLDGTYLTGNSLKLYLKIALKHSLWNLRIDRVLGISLLYFFRKLRFISHEKMKYNAIRIGGKSPHMLRKFSVMAHQMVNGKVKAFLSERHKKGEAILLATAAAESYVPLIWSGEYIASPTGGPDCRSTRKRDAVAQWVSKRGMTISYFLTDHHEDLPLARYVTDNGGFVILVNPSSKTTKIMNASASIL